MGKLHKYLTEFTGDLQKLLQDNQDDDNLIAAIEEKWSGEDDPRLHFLLGLPNRISPQGGRKGLTRGINSIKDSKPSEDKGGRDNIPVGKVPIIDSDPTQDKGDRDNIPVGNK